MSKFPPPAVFEHIVCGIIIHPTNHRILTVRMSANAPNQLAKGQQRHIPGGEVRLNETPEVAIRHRLQEKLGAKVLKAYPFFIMTRSGTLKEDGQVVAGGRRFVITYWFIAEINCPEGSQLEDVLRVHGGYDLAEGSEQWVGFHELIDSDAEHCLGSTAADRTPYVELQQVWPFPHNYGSVEIPKETLVLQ